LKLVALVVFLACAAGLIGTGLLVQHTAELGLDVRYLDAAWAARLYHDEIPTQHRAFRTSTGVWVQLGERTFHDGAPLIHRVGRLIGAVSGDSTTYLADELQVWALDRGDTLIGLLRAPAPIDGLALANGVPVIDTQHGSYEADVSFRSFRRRERAGAADVHPEPIELTSDELAALVERYLADAITIERFLGDFHSGRLFGDTGKYVIDALGLAMLAALLLVARRRR
jgi:hypothetical protein